MDKNLWHRVEQIVDEALQIEDLTKRTQYIELKCASDQTLKKEVFQLLNSIDASGEFWEKLMNSSQNLMDDMKQNKAYKILASDSEQPDRIGSYLIKKKIGSGGMGNVFLAEHESKQFNTKVALKIIRREINHQERIRRFVQERRILSKLNHPNIARLLDGGISEDGRPYFVMEYIEGESITDYCKKNNLSIPDRLRLFNQACDAVQFAHTNFVVHRDLKPDNVIVNHEGNVKVLDFGIAKLLDNELLSEEDVIHTKRSNRFLSLHYAAPEQITLDPVTAATDVYTLGLLLYQLLTNSKAFELAGKKLSETEHIIRTVIPERPSTRASESRNKIKGDLDSIVMKALRKDSKDRYESVALLLEDLERYRNNLPVRARRGNVKYKTAKFFKRNFQAIAISTFFFALLAVFGVYHYQQITEEREVAELEAKKANRVTGILVGTFENANPWKQPNSDITAREILRNGLEFINTNVTDGPEIKAELFSTFGSIYESLGEYSKADSLLNNAIALEEQLTNKGEGNPYSMALHQHRHGIVKQFLGQNQQAKELLKIASDGFQRNGAILEAASSDLEWGWIEYISANYEKADSLFNQSLVTFKELEGDSSINTSGALTNIGWIEFNKGNYIIADSLFSEAIKIKRKNYDGGHPDLARALHSLAWIKYSLNELEEAATLQEESNKMRSTVFKDRPNFDLAWGINNLGIIKQATDNLDEAENLFQTALEMRRSILPPTHPHIAQSMGNLASLYFYREDYKKSADMFHEVLQFQRNVLPEDHPELANSLNNLGTVLSNDGRDEEALVYFEEALKVQEFKLGSSHPNTILFRSNFADSYENLRIFEKAEELRVENFKALLDEKGIEDEATQQVIKNLVELYKLWGKPQKENEYSSLALHD